MPRASRRAAAALRDGFSPYNSRSIPAGADCTGHARGRTRLRRP
ncbi:hypothetical protein OH687_14280 [Burkholderia anthina]|nr:hypothetical protein OH687_14280 [Burkholderia anthina]